MLRTPTKKSRNPDASFCAPHPQADEGSSPHADRPGIDSNGTATELSSARRLFADQRLSPLRPLMPPSAPTPSKQRMPPDENARDRILVRSKGRPASPRSEDSLAGNLLKHLNAGSQDALNLMIGIFEFHRFDTTLLNNYIANRSTENRLALAMQIEKLTVSDAG